jgi:hypothetical protein
MPNSPASRNAIDAGSGIVGLKRREPELIVAIHDVGKVVFV